MEENLYYEGCNSDVEWDNFIYKSENKNIFSISDFLNDSQFKCSRFFIKKKDEILGSFHLYTLNNKIYTGKKIYTPINFKLNNESNISAGYYKKHNIIKCFVDYIVKEKIEGTFILDSYTNDLRPFYWHNHNKSKEIFTIEEVRYTSVLNIEEKFEDPTILKLLESKIFKNFSRSIKQQIKLSQFQNFKFIEKFDLKVVFEILKKTFDRQNLNIDFSIEEYEKIYLRLHKKDLLRMFISNHNTAKEAFCLFGIINDKAIYINGGRSNYQNDDYSLTYTLVMSIMTLANAGVKTFDLEGVNSPKRAFWKQGFGGKLASYYKISIKNN